MVACQLRDTDLGILGMMMMGDNLGNKICSESPFCARVHLLMLQKVLRWEVDIQRVLNWDYFYFRLQFLLRTIVIPNQA